MKTVTAKQLNQDVIETLNELDKTGEIAILVDIHGHKFVVLKEEDYKGWRETAYLLSSSKNSEILQKSLEEPLDKCKDLKNVLRELDS